MSMQQCFSAPTDSFGLGVHLDHVRDTTIAAGIVSRYMCLCGPALMVGSISPALDDKLLKRALRATAAAKKTPTRGQTVRHRSSHV